MHVSQRLMQPGVSKTIGSAGHEKTTPKTMWLSDGGGCFMAVTPAAGHTGVSSLVLGDLQQSGLQVKNC